MTQQPKKCTKHTNTHTLSPCSDDTLSTERKRTHTTIRMLLIQTA